MKKHSTVGTYSTYILAAIIHLILRRIEKLYGIPIIECALEFQILFLGLNEYLKNIS